MKKSIALVFAASSLLLTGCSTTRQATKWEYQQLPTQMGDPALNRLADEGWSVVCTGTSPNGAPFYILKRPKQ